VPCMAQLPELLTASEVAEILRVDSATVRKWATEGVIPAVRIHSGQRMYRFRREDVERLLTPAAEDEAGAV